MSVCADSRRLKLNRIAISSVRNPKPFHTAQALTSCVNCSYLTVLLSRINLLCWYTSVYMVWHQNIWRERVFSCPLYLVNHTSVPLRTTNFLYRDRSLLPSGVLFVRPFLMELSSSSAMALITDTRTLFQLCYGTHHWHSNSSSVCSRRHCLRDCHCTRLSDSCLLFVRFEVSVYYYYYYYFLKLLLLFYYYYFF